MDENVNVKEERVVEILDKTTNSEVNDLIDYLFNILPEDEAGVLIASLVEAVGSNIEDETDEEIEEMVINELDSLMAIMPLLTASYVFDVKLIGLEKQIMRRIEVPCLFTLAELAYAVLGTMNAEGIHLYDIEYGDDIYSCTYADPDDGLYPHKFKFAHDYDLLDFNFKDNNKMILTYDFGDCFRFEITYLKVNSTNHLQSAKFMKVINCKGSGIWEDHHYLLDLYYDDRIAYNRYIIENDIDDDDFKFDLRELTAEVIKEEFFDAYIFIKEMYEGD